jgi:hypothetical protein
LHPAPNNPATKIKPVANKPPHLRMETQQFKPLLLSMI